MNFPVVSFENLKAGRLHQQIVGRMLCHWPARNVKKGGQLMGVDFLLNNEKSCVIQGSINVTLLSKFENSLRDFEVTRSNSRFKLTDSPFSIRFTASTVFDQADESFGSIPEEFFRFRTHEQLVSLANTNTNLPDVMGEVCSSKEYRNGMTQTLERMLVHLCLESGEKVRLSAFDNHASSLEKVFSEKDGGTNILLATNLNPKLGELYLNATSGTKFYSDGDLETTKQFADRLKGKAKENPNSISSFHGVSKIEQVSIHDLNQFVATGNPKEVEFLCIATVTDIQTQRGWYFISCAACGTKMLQNSSSLTCNNFKCGSTTAVGDVKYRVELVVDDGITTGVFVAFDKDMVKLTKIQASTLSSQMTNGELISDSYAPIPQKNLDIVGKKFTFQIKLTDFNFTPHHQPFTVSRIYETIEAHTGDNLNLGVTGCANIQTEPKLTSTSSAVEKTSVDNTSGSGDLAEETSTSTARHMKQKKQKRN